VKYLTTNNILLRYFVVQMVRSAKISSILALSILTAYPLFLSAKNNIKKNNHKISIGFKTGKENTLLQTKYAPQAKTKLYSNFNTSFYIKKQITAHIKIEAGLQNNLISHTPLLGTVFNNNIPDYKESVPVTLQYYMFKRKCKVNPFIGAGLAYNFNNSNSYVYNRELPPAPPVSLPGTHYVSIIYTQGVTYQVNTKIEVTQSFHFINNNTSKIIGIDLGIGYKLP